MHLLVIVVVGMLLTACGPNRYFSKADTIKDDFVVKQGTQVCEVHDIIGNQYYVFSTVERKNACDMLE